MRRERGGCYKRFEGFSKFGEGVEGEGGALRALYVEMIEAKG